MSCVSVARAEATSRAGVSFIDDHRSHRHDRLIDIDVRTGRSRHWTLTPAMEEARVLRVGDTLVVAVQRKGQPRRWRLWRTAGH